MVEENLAVKKEVVAGVAKQAQPQPQQQRRARGAVVVRFADENQTQLFDYDSDECIGDKWWSPEDYDAIKGKSRFEAKEWRRQGYGILLREVYLNPRPDAQEFVNAFVKLAGEQSRRGLERQLSRQHGEERTECKDRGRHAVLIHQRRLRREGLKLEDIAPQLAQIYKEVCRPAKVFARRLGKADEIVVQSGEDSTPAERILEADRLEAAAGGRRMARRLSNMSLHSVNSFDSTQQQLRGMNHRRPPPLRKKCGSRGRCPSSPASPMEEFYAGVA